MGLVVVEAASLEAVDDMLKIKVSCGKRGEGSLNRPKETAGSPHSHGTASTSQVLYNNQENRNSKQALRLRIAVKGGLQGLPVVDRGQPLLSLT